MSKNGTMKSVCIIRSNPVNPDSRVEKEAWSLKRAGYNVHILAWDRASDKRTEDIVTVGEIKIPITRLGNKASYGEGFKNIKAYLRFQYQMRKYLRDNKFDVVHACDFDTAFFSFGVVRRKSEKFVFDIFDFLFDTPTSLMERCVKKAQYRLIDKSDATIICTEERRKQIEGSSPRNLVVIHNTPSLEQRYNREDQASVSSVSAERIRIVYVGILQDYRLLQEIVEAVGESDFMELHIGGFGKYEAYMRENAQLHDNIYFYGRLAYADTLALEKSCDIMLAIYDPSIDNHFFAAPNKFYESLMLGKPVVMVRGTGMSQIVEENDVGVLIDYSKEGFVNGVRQLVAGKEKWNDMGKKMKKLYEEKYSWSEMERRLLKLYDML